MKRVLLALFWCACVPTDPELSEESSISDPGLRVPERVGEEIAELALSEGADVITEKAGPQLIWSRSFRHSNATYIAVHFSSFDLPEGAYVSIRPHDGGPVATYTGTGKANSPGSFWARYVPGSHAVVELHSTVPIEASALMIDRFARGYQSYEMQGGVQIETICGSDDSQWARCYETSEPEIYDRARAVARL